jgi:hypothetical protein
MGKVFSANKLNIPAQQKIDSPDIHMPFYLVRDETFPFEQNLVR